MPATEIKCESFFTTSWDDGSIHDLRLAELLNKYKIKSTFYIPINNHERKDHLGPKGIKDVAHHFEVGAHTFSHLALTQLSNKQAYLEIEKGKKGLEDILGSEIKAFCFPLGKFNFSHLKMIELAGLSFARTTGYFRTSHVLDKEKLLFHTTLQFYPHKPVTYIKSIVRRKDWEGVCNLTVNLKHLFNWPSFLKSTLAYVILNGGVFHLWGHSWEIQENDLWYQLEEFFKHVAECQSRLIFKTNLEIWNDSKYS